MASLLFSPISTSPSSPTLLFHHNPNRIPSSSLALRPSNRNSRRNRSSLTVSSALAESDSPKPLDRDAFPLLQELADSFRLPSDYLAQLPGDLRLDLNDAAFDLANGPVIKECGQELGELLLNLSQAWEQADTSMSDRIVSKFPSLVGSLTDNAKSAFGKRLVSAGRRFQAMGQYGQGELQKIAKIMMETGKLLSAQSVKTTDEKLSGETRMLKFGDLQVAVTPERAYIGAAIAFVFGIVSWQLSQGVQSMPESSLQYANDNALLIAKSLRIALLLMCYMSTAISAFSSVGLILLGRQLSSEGKEQ